MGIALEEYLTHSYSPECEYVDSEIVERNAGDYYHSLLQALLAQHLCDERDRSGVCFRALLNQRMRVRERRYRIPDVMVLAPGHRKTGITFEPPVVTIEIFARVTPSKRSSLSRRSMSDSASPYCG